MAALSAAAVLPMVALAFLAASRQQRREARRFEYDAIRLAQAISDVEESLIERVRILLVELADRAEVAGRPGRRCDSLAADLRRHFPEYANIGVLERDGLLSCSALRRGPAYSPGREDLRRALATRSFTIGSYQNGGQPGRRAVSFVLPVPDASGRPRRVVYAAVALSAWAGREVSVARQIPAGATLMRVDRAGRILATAPRWDSSLVGRSLPILSRIAGDSGESGLVRGRGPGGEPHLYAFARVHEELRGPGIVVVLSAPEAVAYAEARRALRMSLGTVGVVGLGVLVLTWLLGGGLIVRPLRAVAGAAERLASGDLRVRLGPPYEVEEIGQLARAFDAMAASIGARQGERDLALADLGRSEQQLRDLVENAPYGIFRMAPDGRLLYANPAMVRIMGFESAAELQRAWPADLWSDPADRDRALAGYAAAGAEGGIEVRLSGRDGRRVVLRTAGRAVRDDAGRIARFEVFAEDITEERVLEERFSRIFRDSPLASVLTRMTDGQAIEVNEAFLRLTGLDRGEVIGHSTDEMNVYADAGVRDQLYRSLRERGCCSNLRVRLRTAAGAPRTVLISATKLDFGGEPCSLSFAQDITDLEEARSSALQSEEKFAKLFRSSLTAMSLSEIGDGRFIDVNDEYVRLLGFERGELVGKTSVEVGIFRTPEDRARMVEGLRGRTEVRDLEMGLRAKDGRAVEVTSSLQVIEMEGRPVLVAALLDVSAMRDAERALRVSEQRFRTAFMTGSDAYLIVGRDDARVVEMNERAEAMFGWRRDEAVGRTTLELGAWADPTMRERMLAMLRSEGRVRNLEVLARHRDGTTFPVLYSVSELPATEPPLVMGVIRDVSAQMRAAEELRAGERRYRALFTESRDGIFVADAATGAILDANSSMLAMAGRAAADIGAVAIADVVAPEQHDALRAAWQMILAGELRDALEFDLLRPDGTRLPIEARASTFVDAGGKPRLFGVVRDVADRRRLEAERQMLSAALEQAAEVVIITDLHGTIRYVNPAFETLTGYARGEAIGRNPRILKSGMQGPEVYQRMWAALREGRTFAGTFVNRKKGGEHYAAEVVVSPVRDAGGVVVQYVGLQRDVTRVRELEDQLRHAQKMEAIGHLTGGIAHDFNNLLNVISTNATLAREEIQDPNATFGYLADVETAAQQAGALVRKLLAFSRRERLTLVRIDLVEELRDLERTLRRLLPETIRVRFDAGRDPVLVAADEVAFEQIILNLATNARDAMPRGGRLSLGLSEVVCREGHDDHVALGLDAPGRYVVVSVEDTGVGMDRATLQRVFDPFFTTKAPAAGTGLGLAMVFGLMKQHGGVVRVESAPGQGTAVRLYFPADAGKRARPRAERAARSRAERGGETILLVEDQDLLRRAAARALTRLGYAVLPAADGEEGLRVLAEQGDRVALVLSDLIMPTVGGVELYERLRAEGRHVRFLLMSGHTTAPGAAKLPPGVPVIEKPWTVDALARKLRELLDAPPPGV